VSEIGDHLGVTNAASSQLVDRLVEQGLLRRSEAAHDRRFKQVELTEAGQAVIEASATLRRRWMEALTEILQPEEQQAVIHALTSLTMAAQRLEPLPLEEEILIQKE
jgi:DNA-binding MarR family transcriptional regulator